MNRRQQEQIAEHLAKLSNYFLRLIADNPEQVAELAKDEMQTRVILSNITDNRQIDKTDFSTPDA